MGEMADFTLDIDFDVMYGEYDHYSDFPEDYGQTAPRKKMCRYCKETDLHWRQEKGKWKLADIDNIVHCCEKYHYSEPKQIRELK